MSYSLINVVHLYKRKKKRFIFTNFNGITRLKKIYNLYLIRAANGLSACSPLVSAGKNIAKKGASVGRSFLACFARLRTSESYRCNPCRAPAAIL